ncbi:MAG TPA: hypothetical protein VMU77_03195 [Acidimicrobiales bacterium]|nr:hypothetical protein [Acidimicrobiales bacterium]
MATPSELEWFDQLNRSAFTYGLATRGIALTQEKFADTVSHVTPLPKNQTYLAFPKPNDAQVTVYANWRSLELPDLMVPDGPIIRELGRQWVVSVNSLWDSYFRKMIAMENGFTEERELKVPVMGDLNRIRNDIVHHHGIATHENSGKCSVLSKWISVGDEIVVTELMIVEFMDHWGQTRLGPNLGNDASGINVVVHDRPENED